MWFQSPLAQFQSSTSPNPIPYIDTVSPGLAGRNGTPGISPSSPKYGDYGIEGNTSLADPNHNSFGSVLGIASTVEVMTITFGNFTGIGYIQPRFTIDGTASSTGSGRDEVFLRITISQPGFAEQVASFEPCHNTITCNVNTTFSAPLLFFPNTVSRSTSRPCCLWERT